MNENTTKKKIILASKSPRRIEILTNAGFDVRVVPADIEEVVKPNLSPEAVVKSLALQKATAVRKLLDSKFTFDEGADEGADVHAADACDADACDADIIVAADTIVYHDGIIGKPKDRDDAERILLNLSGKVHQVYTGVAIIYNKSGGESALCAGCAESNAGCAGSTSGCAATCKKRAIKNGRYGLVFSERTDVFFKPYTKEELQDYLDTDEPYDKAGAYAIQGYFGQFIDHIDGDYSNVMGLPLNALLEKLKTID